MTEFFFELTPERVLAAAEASGLRCNGRCLALNSYENRVYELELEEDETNEKLHPIARKRVAKFYRPGRWNRKQILEEHQFLLDLKENEIPVVAPLVFRDGSTLQEMKDAKIWYALFPKVGGRIPDELDDEQLHWIGRLLARIHSVGASKESRHRMTLTPDTYGRMNLAFLLKENWIVEEFRERYEKAVKEICNLADPLFKRLLMQRIHGDCHLGNLLWGAEGPFFLDFDDMLRGPPVQDFWLLIPGRDEEAKAKLEVLLEGYEEMRSFDRSTLKLIEILRALRFVHFSAWLARRWKDPAFPRAFPEFNTLQYWRDRTTDLEQQLALIQDEIT